MMIFDGNKYLKKLYILLVVIGIGLILFTYNNYHLYNETIVRVVGVKDKYITTEEVTFGYKDDIYIQTLDVKVLNGSYKGKKIKIENEYHKGEAYDQKYRIGDELFVTIYKKNGNVINANINGYKRDKYIVVLIVCFILVIGFVGQYRGLLSVISVFLNIILFYVLIYINAIKNINLPLLSFVGSIVFSIICLSLVSGLNKKTLAAILSSVISIVLITVISLIVIKVTNYSGIRFEQMELLTRPYEGIFISEIILGGLGAIMDISISLSSSLNELIDKNKRITTKKLMQSGFNIGQDIMGTMVNVLFFTFVSMGIANLIIYYRNGISIANLISEYISLEMTRALTGAIGIVITIPVAIFITLLIYKRRVKL